MTKQHTIFNLINWENKCLGIHHLKIWKQKRKTVKQEKYQPKYKHVNEMLFFTLFLVMQIPSDNITIFIHFTWHDITYSKHESQTNRAWKTSQNYHKKRTLFFFLMLLLLVPLWFWKAMSRYTGNFFSLFSI